MTKNKDWSLLTRGGKEKRLNVALNAPISVCVTGRGGKDLHFPTLGAYLSYKNG